MVVVRGRRSVGESGEVVVDAVRAEPAHRRRLSELGVRPGARLRVLRRTAGGGAVLAVGDGRVAVDVRTLRAVVLRPVEGSP